MATIGDKQFSTIAGPDAHNTSRIARSQQTAIGRPGEGQDTMGEVMDGRSGRRDHFQIIYNNRDGGPLIPLFLPMLLIDPLIRNIVGVPELYGAIATARSEPLAVRRPGDGKHLIGMASIDQAQVNGLLALQSI